MLNEIKIHFWTLGRWFGLPFFGTATLIGAVLAGGSITALNTWLGFITAALVMAGGHSFNTYLDTVWTKLDATVPTHLGMAGTTSGAYTGSYGKPVIIQGPTASHSVEKVYTAGSVVISEGWASQKAVLINALVWYALSLIPAIFLAIRVTPIILVPTVIGMAITFAYSPSKFTYFHETVLASGVVAAAAIGALSTGTGEWIKPLLVTTPLCLIFCFAGLALDEYPDAEQNIPKGVRSLAYKVWQYQFDLALYIMLWVFSAFLIQMLFISIGWLKPLTGVAFVILLPAIAISLFLKKYFKPAAMALVAVAMAYPIILIITEVLG